MSLEFWSLSQKDYGDAWKRYFRFVSEGGKKTFVDLCRVADIRVPFEDGALDEIADGALAYLAR